MWRQGEQNCTTPFNTPINDVRFHLGRRQRGDRWQSSSPGGALVEARAEAAGNCITAKQARRPGLPSGLAAQEQRQDMATRTVHLCGQAAATTRGDAQEVRWWRHDLKSTACSPGL